MTANAQLAVVDKEKGYKYLMGRCANCGKEEQRLRLADFTICNGNVKLPGLAMTCRAAGTAAVTSARAEQGKPPIVHQKRRKLESGAASVPVTHDLRASVVPTPKPQRQDDLAVPQQQRRPTMREKVDFIIAECRLDPLLNAFAAVTEANTMLGVVGHGPLVEQVDKLLTELGAQDRLSACTGDLGKSALQLAAEPSADARNSADGDEAVVVVARPPSSPLPESTTAQPPLTESIQAAVVAEEQQFPQFPELPPSPVRHVVISFADPIVEKKGVRYEEGAHFLRKSLGASLCLLSANTKKQMKESLLTIAPAHNLEGTCVHLLGHSTPSFGFGISPQVYLPCTEMVQMMKTLSVHELVLYCCSAGDCAEK